MTISWYSIISAQNGGAIIFNGYFSVDDATNLVTGFYDLSLPINNSYTDVILPINDEASWAGSNNIYPFNQNGLNFYSTALQQFFDISQNHFNLYSFYNDGNLSFYTEASGNLVSPPYTIVIQSIPGPPSPVACFKEDTKILTNKGYILIQDLRKGDLVKTLKHDFKPIDMIGKREIYHPALKERIKDQLYKCSSSEYSELFEALVITGCHSILVDEFISKEQEEKTIEINSKIYLTDDKYRLPACADERASVYETPGKYTIYHLALDNNDYYMNYGIFANGLLVETCSQRYLKELSGMTLI